MVPLCPACIDLQLPSPEQFDGRGKHSRSFTFDFFCTTVEGNNIQPASQSAEVDQPGIRNDGAVHTGFCGKCDFCTLIFDALSRRYGTDIEQTFQGLRKNHPDHSEIDGSRLILKLSILSFHSTSNWAVTGGPNNLKDISLITLEGVLNITCTINKMDVATKMALLIPLEVFADHDEMDSSTGFEISRRPLDPQTLSSGNVERIQNWLRDCQDDHPKCSLSETCEDDNSFYGENEKRLFLPTTLVYVGKPCPGHDPRVIVPSREFPTGLVDPNHIRYLALSYCWGSMEEGQRPLVSTVETLDDRQEAIPWATIPKAFQDLIFLARTLGIYYVWIDSLCIIQGEGGDWDQESSKMWSVYSNAFLTVIAAAGSSSHVGFLNRPLSRCCRVMLPKPSAQYSLRYRPGTKWWGTDRMAEITGKAWISRGWTYQEERLARRVLMFGENKFFFDCRMAERAEDTAAWSPRPEWSEIIYTQNLDDGSGLTPGTKGKSVGDKKRRLFNDWQWLCTQYSHRVLSFPQDKLPAFSGVASAVAPKVKSRYLAGLWEVNLMHDLFWHPRGAATKSQIYRAPSWSWAALETGSVNWREPKTCLGEKCRPYCEILEAETCPVGPSPFGAISSAFLTIKGNIIEVYLGGPEEHMNDPPRKMIYQEQKVGRVNVDLLGPDVDDDSSNNFWALLMTTCGLGYAATRGLLLHKTGHKDGHDVYERRGTFYIYASTAVDLDLKVQFWTRSNLVVCRIE